MTISLLVADDLELRRLLSSTLANHGIGVRIAERSRDLSIELARGGIDIVLLDTMLRAVDGIELCRELRLSSKTPVILFTASGDSISRVLGLEMGADDCVEKPVGQRELLARIKAILRRCEQGKEAPSAEHDAAGGATRPIVTRIGGPGGWALDWRNRTLLSPDSERLPLSNVEYRLLTALAEHAGQVMSRQYLAELTRSGPMTVNERAVDLAVSRLRAKLRESAARPRLIQTVRGSGYQLMSDPVTVGTATFTLRSHGHVERDSASGAVGSERRVRPSPDGLWNSSAFPGARSMAVMDGVVNDLAPAAR